MVWVAGKSAGRGIRGQADTGNAVAGNSKFTTVHYHRNFDLIGLGSVCASICLDGEFMDAAIEVDGCTAIVLDLTLKQLSELMPEDHVEYETRTQLLQLGGTMAQYVGRYDPQDEKSQADADEQEIQTKLGNILGNFKASRASQPAPEPASNPAPEPHVHVVDWIHSLPSEFIPPAPEELD